MVNETFWFRFKKFLWYLATEPIRQTKFIVINLSEALDKSLTWVGIFLVMGGVAAFLNKRIVLGWCLAFILIFYLLWLWQDGRYMYRFRENEKKKIKEKMNEVEKHELDRNFK